MLEAAPVLLAMAYSGSGESGSGESGSRKFRPDIRSVFEKAGSNYGSAVA